MLSAAHRLHFARRHQYRMRRQPNEQRQRQRPEQELIIGLVPLPSFDARHALPDVIVHAEKQRADQERLDDEQPGEQPPHHGHAHALAECIDRAHEPIARDRHRQQRADRDEQEDVPHPVEIGPFSVRFAGKKSIAGIGKYHGAAGHNVGEEPMHIERIPERGMQEVPSVPQETPLRIHPGWRHHEGGPCIRQQQERRSENVGQDADRRVNPLQSRLGHAIPAVVVDNKQQRFSGKHDGISRHEGLKRSSHVLHETGVEDDEHGQHDTSHHRRHRQREQRDLGQVSRKSVIAQRQGRLLRDQAQEFKQGAKERQRQHKAAEIGMLLRNEPDE